MRSIKKKHYSNPHLIGEDMISMHLLLGVQSVAKLHIGSERVHECQPCKRQQYEVRSDESQHTPVIMNINIIIIMDIIVINIGIIRRSEIIMNNDEA